MEIILLEKIQKLGQIGDVVKVKPGYARNFLVPQGKALYATEENKNVFKEKKENIEADNLKKKSEAEKLLKQFTDKEVILIRAASDSGQLYGSVTSKDIAKSLNEEKLSVNKNQIILNKSLKYLTYEKISITLHPEVFTEIILNVARSKEEAEKQSKTKKAIVSVLENSEENPILEEDDKPPLLIDDELQKNTTIEDKESVSKLDKVKEEETESSKKEQNKKEDKKVKEKKSLKKDNK